MKEKFIKVYNPDRICPDLTPITQSTFSKKCDIMLYLPNISENKPKIDDHIKTLGYFAPGFYMIDPYRYIGGEKTDKETLADDGVLFRFVEDADVEKLEFSESAFPVGPEALESIRFIFFRIVKGSMTIDESHCLIDAYEFVGVYKAEKNPEASTYKMTKIFDRFYFDESKLLETNNG